MINDKVEQAIRDDIERRDGDVEKMLANLENLRFEVENLLELAKADDFAETIGDFGGIMDDIARFSKMALRHFQDAEWVNDGIWEAREAIEE